MLRGPLAAIFVVAIVAAAGCGQGTTGGNEAGECKIKPHTVCKNMDLRGISMVAADLTGSDFSGSDLRDSDLREVTLDDANLSGTNLGDIDFTDASLKNANLSKSYLFGTNFTSANLTGANFTGSFVCNMTKADGGFDPGNCAAVPGKPAPTPKGTPKGPPAIESFTVAPPGKCLNDTAGDGVEVQYTTKNATGVVFFVDTIRIDGSSPLKGTKRLPFICDSKPHSIEMQAFGVNSQIVKRDLSISLDPAAPLSDNS